MTCGFVWHVILVIETERERERGPFDPQSVVLWFAIGGDWGISSFCWFKCDCSIVIVHFEGSMVTICVVTFQLKCCNCQVT